MKFVIAQMKHETNTFSPVPTPLFAFGKNGPYFGRDAFDAMRGTATPMGAFIDHATKLGAEIVTPVAGDSPPSGPVAHEAYATMCDAIVKSVEQGCDALFLDLHGAMVVESTDDGEGDLLERLRRLAPTLPIAVALDLHANITEKMVANCDVIAGYKTYPHVDMYEAGDLTARILLRYLKGEIKPVMAWGNRPVLAQTLKMNTAEGAMGDFVAAAKLAEQQGLLAATAFGGFPLADIRDAGLSAVVVADGNRQQARNACDNMLDLAWKRRDEFIYHGEPLADSITRAMQIAEGPILLLDHCDNCASGGTQDTMRVLGEALRQGASNLAAGPIRDEKAVAQCIAAGVGAKITLQVGGKMDMPSINLQGEPLELTGVVRAITDGEYTITGPQLTGVRSYMGRTAVLDTGTAEIVICERSQEPWDLGVFTSVGIDPRRKTFLVLKSRMYFRPVFLPIAKAAIECNGVGVTSSDWTLFPYRKIRRPIFPLDAMNQD